jgi:hypothetical protein
MNPSESLFEDIKTLKEKVEYVLKRSEKSRNSDTTLMIEIWKWFYSEHLSGDSIPLKSLYEVPNQDDVKRLRAYWQNDKLMYLPTVWEVAKQRKINEEVWKKALGYSSTLF